MLAVTATAAAVLAAAGCSLLGGTARTASTATTRAASATVTPSSFSPLAGPTEAAGALPKQCSRMLTTEQLQAVFGAGFPIGDDYGSYAALSSIGRTGRVVCVFGVGLDSFGRRSTGSIEIAIATYRSAPDAVGRAADTVRSDAEAGATTTPVSVGGHPATIVVERGAAEAGTGTGTGTSGSGSGSASTGAPSPATSSASATSAASAASAASGASATSAASAISPASAASAGETELVMADGNRTFVLQIPFAKLPSEQALTALTRLALEVYRNTLPAVASSARPGSSTR